MIFIEVLEVAYVVIFFGEKERKKKGEAAAIVGAEDASKMGYFWLVMEGWAVTGNNKIFVLGLTPHLLICFFFQLHVVLLLDQLFTL